jgi:hypothetical protein
VIDTSRPSRPRTERDAVVTPPQQPADALRAASNIPGPSARQASRAWARILSRLRDTHGRTTRDGDAGGAPDEAAGAA